MKLFENIIINLARQNFSSHEEFYRAMRRLCNQNKTAPLSKATLISTYRQLLKKKKIARNVSLETFLVKGAIRTLSGVTVISLLTKPYPCPGTCLYCPTEPGMPKSYLSNEPAVQRAIRNQFHPARQAQKRIEALERNGHQVDKIEIIILGGTWSAYPRIYQRWFVTQCFYAANTYSLANKKKKRSVKSLGEEQKINETSRYKIIGLTIETRSDHVTPDEIRDLRELGCTRVQLGIQHVDNDILDLNRRNERTEDHIRATALLKAAGFKVDHHYMLDLPGSTPSKDRAMFKRIFRSDGLQPDQIKIYPCVVNEYAQLYHWYKSGKYKPYPAKELVKLMLDVKKMIPPYVRTNRIVRDIPEESIVAGNDITNLRQHLHRELIARGTPCKCIRCREARADVSGVATARFVSRSYRASGGIEHFISFESPDKKIIYAFVRLRFNNAQTTNNHFIPELKGAALIRELHVYGLMTPVEGRTTTNTRAQHLSLGKKLMLEAERRSHAAGYSKVAVISGIGVKNYYRKLGYRLQGTYMVKRIK